MFYKDNWFAWTYDDGPEYGPKLNPKAEFKIILRDTIDRPVKSYYEELLQNAQELTDLLSGPFDLLFSGGIDSEVILRVYLELKIPLNVYIFKYENDYNLIEFTQAVKTCEVLGVTPHIIDFNLQKFFENDAYDIWSKCFAFNTGWLPHMKMTEYLDNIPIIGSGEPYWHRTSRDTTKKYPWVFELDEKPHHWAVYHKTIGRQVITDWYEYSPEIIIAYSQLPYVQALINDNIPGKLTNISSKAIIHQPYWPDLASRPKLIGFEGPEPDKSKPSVPPFMIEFGKKYIRETTTAQHKTYSEQELFNLIYSH